MWNYFKNRIESKKNINQKNLSGKEYQILFDTMTIGVVFQNKKGEVVLANNAAEDILGLTLSQMQGRTSIDPRWKAIHEDGSPFPGEEHPAMISLKTGKVVINTVMGVFNPNKEKHVWININAVPLINKEEKKPYQVYTTFEDITYQKNTDLELNTYFNSSGFMFCIADKNNYFVKVNKTFEKTLGFTQAELSSKSYIEFIHPDDIDRTKKVIEGELKKGAEVFAFDNRYRCKDGTYKWLRWTASPFLDLGLTYAIAFDITDKIEIENELKKTEELHKTVMENIYDPVFITDDDGNFTFICNNIHYTLGYTKEELFELKSIKNLLNKNIFDLTKLVKSTQISNIEALIEDKNGNKKNFLITIKKVSIKNGTILYVCRDITERKKLEDNKRIQEKMFLRHQRLLSLGELSASIAHEIRQPLQVIKVITDTIIYKHGKKKKLPKACEDNVEDLVKVSKSIEKISNIITDLQDIVKRPDEKSNIIDINHEIRKILDFFDQQFKRHSIEKKLDMNIGVKEIRFPDSQFQQVFSNLIKNSIEAFNRSDKTEKVIIVKTGEQDGHIIIEIIDNAIGINNEIKEKIFDPVFSTKENGDSLGMGLFIVNNILVANNSSISFNNNKLGGTTFKIILNSGDDT